MQVDARAKALQHMEQYDYDSVLNTARCAMHFKPKGGRKVLDVFTYDWRLWTIAELKELLAER